MKQALPLFWTALLLVAAPILAQPHEDKDAGKPKGDEVPLYGNLGDHHHKITTKSPPAQEYFDQGLRLLYGFNHNEAILSFKEAAKLDPDCAMAYWGVALGHGPNYNLEMDEERGKAALEALKKAVELAPKTSEPERAYIDALAKRYSVEKSADRKALDKAYADAMRELSRKYPDDADAATLFAESMMDLRPWDLWTPDGQPQPGTLEIVETLERVLKMASQHPGANHFYIHATEASLHPEKALPSADRLGGLMPGAGHMVHMPSHTYIRTGRYADAADVNAKAAEIDRKYIAARKPQGIYPMMYYPHNVHFLWAAASFDGRSAEAIQAATDVAKAVTPEMVAKMPMVEFASPTPLFALARFGKWDEILKAPAPPDALKYTTGMWRYARGLALAAKGKTEEAAAEGKALTSILQATPKESMIGLNSAASLLGVASKVLKAEVAAKGGQSKEAIGLLEEGVKLEDGLKYEEPPGWYQPVRELLGAALLASGEPAEAEAIYREDLKKYPENGWSLFGLEQSLRAQKKEKEAAEALKRFEKAWSRADVKLMISRF